MISRGERGSRIGNPAISATVLSMLALRLARAAGEVSRGAGGAVATFSAPTPNGVLHYLTKNSSSLNGDVSSGDNFGSLIFIKPKPAAS